jgi:hypothetical protein
MLLRQWESAEAWITLEGAGTAPVVTPSPEPAPEAAVMCFDNVLRVPGMTRDGVPRYRWNPGERYPVLVHSRCNSRYTSPERNQDPTEEQ